MNSEVWQFYKRHYQGDVIVDFVFSTISVTRLSRGHAQTGSPSWTCRWRSCWWSSRCWRSSIACNWRRCASSSCGAANTTGQCMRWYRELFELTWWRMPWTWDRSWSCLAAYRIVMVGTVPGTPCWRRLYGESSGRCVLGTSGSWIRWKSEVVPSPSKISSPSSTAYRAYVSLGDQVISRMPWKRSGQWRSWTGTVVR